MSAARNSRIKKATALVPLAVLSVAWTVSVAGVGGSSAPVPVAQQETAATLPDGTALPGSAIEAPASVTAEQGSLATPGNATQILSTASAAGIPSAALAAYQRAETVINAADSTCRLPWQLVAAIGRVESNHGRANSNVLDDDGLASPGIFGLPLDGTNATTLINDTDAGQYDNDTTYDRAVGPMQFIPSTWAVVGVDADGDGARNPQDIDDAALGTAVYLCSGTDDLSTPEGQQAAVFRYNHSQSYVDLVLSVMQAYMSGDFTTIPNSTVAAGILSPTSVDGSTGKRGVKKVVKPTKKPTKKPTVKPTVVPPTTPPTTPPTPTATPTPTTPTKTPTKKPTPTVPVPSVVLPVLPSTSVAPVDQLLSVTQATAQCALDLGLKPGELPLLGVLNSAAFQKCIDGYTTPK